jgi:hypothetical protein
MWHLQFIGVRYSIMRFVFIFTFGNQQIPEEYTGIYFGLLFELLDSNLLIFIGC